MQLVILLLIILSSLTGQSINRVKQYKKCQYFKNNKNDQWNIYSCNLDNNEKLIILFVSISNFYRLSSYILYSNYNRGLNKSISKKSKKAEKLALSL